MELSEAPVIAKVKPGYKKTEVGVIPEDWNVMPLDQLAFVTSGKRLPLGEALTDRQTEHPYIRVTDMRPGTVDVSEIKYVPDEVFPAIQQYRIYKEDLFISVAGTLGIVGKIPDELDGANLTENANRITRIKCSRDYLLHVLLAPLIQTTIDGLRTVGAQPKLALGRIRKFDIPLPATEAEQRAIATALSNVDALLGSLDALIAKKKAIKQGTMQRLLTGKQRLKGFEGEWEVKRLGDVAEVRKGVLITAETAKHGSVPVISGGIKPSYYHNTANRFGRTLTVSASGANAGYVGFHTQPIFACDCSTIEESIGYDLMFMYYLLLNRQREIFLLQTGGAQPHIYPEQLRSMDIYIPSDKKEQTAIATVLSDMDVELEALEARRSKTALLKQGMMQELLTGRTRLV